MDIKKIESKEEREKREGRNKRIISLIVGIVLVVSIVGAGFSLFLGNQGDSSSIKKVKYNDLDFYSQGDLWQTQISGQTFYFHYLPNETLTTNIKKTLQDYSGKPLYFVGNDAAEQEIAANLANYVLRIQQACLKYTNCTENLPVKNCSDNVIVISEKQGQINPIVTQEDNCIFISSNDTVREADSFLYKILGVK